MGIGLIAWLKALTPFVEAQIRPTGANRLRVRFFGMDSRWVTIAVGAGFVIQIDGAIHQHPMPFSGTE